MSASDRQVGGDHYKAKLQHWDLLPLLGFTEEYYIGQATKYLTRWRKKHGVRDIRKGQHFLEKLNELGFVRSGSDVQKQNYELAERTKFYDANDVPEFERKLMDKIFYATDPNMYLDVIESYNGIAADAIMAGTAAGAHADPDDKPVSANFWFLGYGDDHATMKWKCRHCNEELSLDIDKPPVYAHKCW